MLFRSIPNGRISISRWRRPDVVILGKTKIGEALVIVLELKGYSDSWKYKPLKSDFDIRVERNGDSRDLLHPCDQASSYASDYLEITDQLGLPEDYLYFDAVAFLQNCKKLSGDKKSVLFAPKFRKLIADVPLYIGSDASKRRLAQYLHHSFEDRDGGDVYQKFCEFQNEAMTRMKIRS